MKMKKTIYSMAALAGMVLMGAPGAFADVTVVYKMTGSDGNGLQTIRYADKQHVRMDMSSAANHQMYMLKLGDKVYTITGKTVQDMSQLSQMMAAMGRGRGMGRHNTPAHSASTPIKYEDTGRTETIAGIRGEVYSFVERGKRHEVVLGKNKDLQDAVLGMVGITRSMTGTGMMKSDPASRVQEDSSIKSMSLLRFDDRVRLQSMNTNAIPDSTFELPAKPQQMGGMGSLMKGLLGR